MLKGIFSAVVCFAFALSLHAQEKITITGGNIRVRAASPIAANQPIVFVNEFETNMQSLALDPGTIESITVLKSESATALYGSKGVNGVILIKTKPGTEFYTIADFVKAEKNAGVQQVKLNEVMLPDMKKLLVEKKALKQTAISSSFTLDETCKAVSQVVLVVTTNSGN